MKEQEEGMQRYKLEEMLERATSRGRYSMPKLPEPRRKRYMQKIHHGRHRIALVKEWQKERASEYEIKGLLAIEKAAQESIEVDTDLMATILKDISIPPTDDYTNISRVLYEGIITEEIGGVLREANGLRNRLIHVYNDIEQEVLLQSIKRVTPGISEFLDVAENWLSG